MLKNFSEENFEQEVKQVSAQKPVLVDFFAPWCGPCQMMGPILESLAEELGEKVVIGKVNVDENQNLAAQFQIMSIPNMKIFKNGEVVEEIVGARSKDDLKAVLEKHL